MYRGQLLERSLMYDEPANPQWILACRMLRPDWCWVEPANRPNERNHCHEMCESTTLKFKGDDSFAWMTYESSLWSSKLVRYLVVIVVASQLRSRSFAGDIVADHFRIVRLRWVSELNESPGNTSLRHPNTSRCNLNDWSRMKNRQRKRHTQRC